MAAIGVAAHECGHAIQHQVGYAPLQIRGALVPVANFGSTIAWPLILLGLFFNSQMSQVLLNLGILAFSLAVLFQIVTLPVEFNASRRAIKILGESNLLYPDGTFRNQKGTDGSSTYLCCRCSFCNPSAFADPDSDRWQKRRLDIEEIS